MTTRRNFIKTTSAAAIAGLVLPKTLLAIPTDKMIGIQLYTIRELVKADFQGTLKKLSEIGYKTIEAAGYSNRQFYGMLPKEYKTVVADLGLIPLSSHTGINLENASQVIEDHAEAGMTYIVIPSMPGEYRETISSYKKAAEEFNKIGELCNKSGLSFGYHNHAFEFEMSERQLPYDVLLENTEADLVTMELDTYWMVYGGQQPMEYFEKYSGRFKLWHVKDMVNYPLRTSTEIGSGIIDFEELFDAGNLAGLEHYFVEQEEFKMDPIKSITESFNYLNSL